MGKKIKVMQFYNLTIRPLTDFHQFTALIYDLVISIPDLAISNRELRHSIDKWLTLWMVVWCAKGLDKTCTDKILTCRTRKFTQ